MQHRATSNRCSQPYTSETEWLLWVPKSQLNNNSHHHVHQTTPAEGENRVSQEAAPSRFSETQRVSNTALARTLPEALLTKDTERLKYSMPFLPQSLPIISLQESQTPETSKEVCKRRLTLHEGGPGSRTLIVDIHLHQEVLLAS